ncbi:hypothetical protein WUBG_05844 [Wuchereria bancrofti]|uniref:Uncharacterized protein n=1 Tax=Wuchereria bancrofti TaxID=6293 RepID=J9B856_WUCBA|nr:hypothetical protein WUBG_05844 [Wuchereria bancrofti]
MSKSLLKVLNVPRHLHQQQMHVKQAYSSRSRHLRLIVNKRGNKRTEINTAISEKSLTSLEEVPETGRNTERSDISLDNNTTLNETDSKMNGLANRMHLEGCAVFLIDERKIEKKGAKEKKKNGA